MTTSHSMESNLITKAVKESFEYIGRLFSNIRYSDTSLPFKAANIRIIKDDKVLLCILMQRIIRNWKRSTWGAWMGLK